MKIEVAALCDAATDQSGKLNMLGVFDYIEAELPVVIPRWTVVFRLRYTRSEVSSHHLQLTVINSDDNSELFPAIESEVKFLPISEGMDSSAVNLILNMNRVRISKGGKYLLKLRIDEILAEMTLPLFVNDLTPQEPNPLAS